jgi:hypothetical protein
VDLDWGVADLERFDLARIDNSRWHVVEQPVWPPLPEPQLAESRKARLIKGKSPERKTDPLVEGKSPERKANPFAPADKRATRAKFSGASVATRVPSWCKHVPSSSPLHAWLGFARKHHQRVDCVRALFRALMMTGCDDSAILNSTDASGVTPLVYALRVPRRSLADQLLPVRLLLAHPRVHPTVPCVPNALRTALVWGHDVDIVLEILCANPNPGDALLRRSRTACLQLLRYPSLARAFLPSLAARESDQLFSQSYHDGGDFAVNLALVPDNLLWFAVTSRLPEGFRLPLDRTPPSKLASDWNRRDGLRSAIDSGHEDRALWMLEHTNDNDLDSYDCCGLTVLMRAVFCNTRSVAGAKLTRLIIALLHRAPALDVGMRSVEMPGTTPAGTVVCSGQLLPPEALTRADLAVGNTAREFFLIHCRPFSPGALPGISSGSGSGSGSSGARGGAHEFVAVSVAFDAAESKAKTRSIGAREAIARLLGMPVDLQIMIALYATV